ncbi:hypothetical protein [Aquisphaera giovannonii]|nr:hypothetical protein [Aquisphaera giovannonii]
MGRSPRWLVPVAIVALLWNLLGCAACLADALVGPEEVAKMAPAQRALYEARPAWALAATAAAVLGGALGSLGLALRKRWAYPLLAISLAGLIVQDFGLFVLAGGLSLAGPAVVAIQGAVLLVAIALALLARRALARGWIA